MKAILLKLRLLFFLSFLLSFSLQAQNSRFIYIQAENKQPFYVKIDTKILSSSTTGYIILPQLVEGAYQLVIGFPGNEHQELNVTVNVKDKNTGYLLKKKNEKDWGIFNLQTMDTLTSEKQSAEKKEEVKKSEIAEFALILAQVVNDPSIAEVTVVKKADEEIVKAKDDKIIVAPIVKEEIKSVEVKLNSKDTITDKAEISKVKQENTSEGLLITYLDIANAVIDTVKIFIPVNKTETVVEKEKQIEIPEKEIINKKNTVNPDTRFIDMELQNPNAKKDSAAIIKDDFIITEKKAEVNSKPVAQNKMDTAVLETNKVVINPNCKKSSTQNDFLELRKNMAAETSENKMIKTANKQFIKTCFTTEQIKNLGVLFISEDERYKFYVAAFPFVSDVSNFSALEDQLSGEYYKIRFKAMLSH